MTWHFNFWNHSYKSLLRELDDLPCLLLRVEPPVANAIELMRFVPVMSDETFLPPCTNFRQLRILFNLDSPPLVVRQVPVKRIEFMHGQDRKSTRLNSSHSQISYAVFC